MKLTHLKTSLCNMYTTVSVFLLLLLPYVVLAQEKGIKYEVKSHIKFTTIEELIVGVLNIFIVIAVPIIVLFIIYAGFLYVTARGSVQQIEQATRAFTYAVIGGVIILGAVALSEVIKNVVDAFKA